MSMRVKLVLVATLLCVGLAGLTVRNHYRDVRHRRRRQRRYEAQDRRREEATRREIEAFVERLRSTSAVERGNAAYALGYRREESPVAVRALIELLDDHASLMWKGTPGVGSPRVATSPAREAEEALLRIGKAHTAGALAGAAETAERAVIRVEAARMLAQLGDERALGILSAHLRSEDASVRIGAIRSLRHLPGARAIPLLTEALKDANASVRQSAASALESLDPSRPRAEP